MRRVGARAVGPRSYDPTTGRGSAAPPGRPHATRVVAPRGLRPPRRLRSFMYTVCNLLRITQNRTRWPGAVPFDVRARRTKRAAPRPAAARRARAYRAPPGSLRPSTEQPMSVVARAQHAAPRAEQYYHPPPSRVWSAVRPRTSRARTPATFGLADRRLGTRTHRAHTLCTHSAWHITRRPGNRPRLRTSTHR